MKTLTTLELDSIICATSYAFAPDVNTRFDTLVKCYNDIGFTNDCSTLWAHYAATNSVVCGDVCLPDPSTGRSLLHGDPPECAAQSCLTCTRVFQGDFDDIAGRTLWRSGITERIVQYCGDIYRVDHGDPCVGTSERGDEVTESPTAAPGSSGGSSNKAAALFGNLGGLLLLSLSLEV
jgi:hypothetical protein